MSFAGLTEEDRKGLQTISAQQKGYSCPSGAYCSAQAGTNVSGSTRPIFHRTTTTLTRDTSNKVTGSKTEVYILSDGNWVRAATTTDGGKTYSFNEETRSDGTKIVGAGLRQSFAPGGNMNKNVKKQTSDTLKSGGAELIQETKLTPKELSDAGYPQASQEEVDSDISAATQELTTQKSNTREKFNTSLTYPLKLNTKLQDVVQFDMIKYRPKPISSSSGSLNPIGDRPDAKEVIGRVFLPIPSGISDNKTVNWAEDSMTPVEAMLTELANTGITQGGGAMAERAGQQAQNIVSNSEDVQAAITNKFVSAAVGTQNLLSRQKGAVINPNMELLFLGPQLRPFTFTFKLSARNKEESKAILTIIRFFKQGMSPIRSESNLFLKSPHTFQIKYLYQGNSHKFLNRFKEAALTGFSVNYTPEGQYATYEDGAMISYQIDMQFTELEPVFNDDYGLGSQSNGYDTEIGY